MNVRHAAMVAGFASIPFAGCGSTSDASPGAVKEWLGASPHLAISGTFQDKTFNIDMEGDAAKGIYCHRFYAPLEIGVAAGPDGLYDSTQVPVYFVMKELGGVIQLDGQPMEFTIAYWRHDVAAGTDLQVIPRMFGTSLPDGQTWSDINLFAPDAGVLSNIESAAVSGTVSVKLSTGVPDAASANGVYIAHGGRTGEFISASWGPHEDLNVSVTADCDVDTMAAGGSTAQIITWPQTRILPFPPGSADSGTE